MRDSQNNATELKDKATDILSHAEELANTYKDLAMLNLTQKLVNAGSAAFAAMIVYAAGLFVVLMCGIALAIWLGDVVHSRTGGFLLGAVFFAAVMIIAISLREKIVFSYFRDKLIRRIYEDEVKSNE
jgi:hypothetical protein